MRSQAVRSRPRLLRSKLRPLRIEHRLRGDGGLRSPGGRAAAEHVRIADLLAAAGMCLFGSRRYPGPVHATQRRGLVCVWNLVYADVSEPERPSGLYRAFAIAAASGVHRHSGVLRHGPSMRVFSTRRVRRRGWHRDMRHRQLPITHVRHRVNGRNRGVELVELARHRSRAGSVARMPVVGGWSSKSCRFARQADCKLWHQLGPRAPPCAHVRRALALVPRFHETEG